MYCSPWASLPFYHHQVSDKASDNQNTPTTVFFSVTTSIDVIKTIIHKFTGKVLTIKIYITCRSNLLNTYLVLINQSYKLSNHELKGIVKIKVINLQRFIPVNNLSQ